jgi:hypothetical protein
LPEQQILEEKHSADKDPYKLPLDNYFSMKDGTESYTVSGEGLSHGVPLAMQYSGTGYHTALRLLGDWASNLYLIQKIDNKKGTNNNG